MIEAPTRWGAVETIGRGVREAPSLRSGIFVTLALAFLGALGRISVPILIQQAIDRGVVDGEIDIALIAALCAVAMVVTIVAAIGQRAAVYRLGTRSEEALYTLRVRLVEHIHRLSIADHGEERKGSLVARVTSDVETLAQFFSWGALAWMLDGTLVVLVAMVMIAYDWILAMVAFVCVVPLIFVLRATQRRLTAAYDEAREGNAEVLTNVSEVISGAETLREYGAGEHYSGVVRVSARRRSRAYIKAGTIGAFLFPSGEVFSVLTLGAVVGVGVARGPASGLTAGTMVGFVFLIYRLFEPIAELTEIMDETQSAVAGLRRVVGVLEIPIGPPEPESPTHLPDGPLDVDIEHVDFSYSSRGAEDEPPVLFDVSVHIPAGQQVAVVGETGSGKTTLGRLIARLADPTAGTVMLGGLSLTRVSNAELRTRLVVVPQEPFLFEGTIAENLSFAKPGLAYEDLVAAVTDLDLDDWLETMSDGLATEVGQRGAQLSAGERQLVALVRASLVDPDVLLLDEATSSVDALTEVRMARALDRLASGRTTIAIAHRLSTAARADRVLVLDHGHLVEDGSHGELVGRGGVYTSMYEAWVRATAAA